MISKLNNNLSHLLPSEPVNDVIDWDSMAKIEVGDLTNQDIIDGLKYELERKNGALDCHRFVWEMLNTMYERTRQELESLKIVHVELVKEHSALQCKYDEYIIVEGGQCITTM